MAGTKDGESAEVKHKDTVVPDLVGVEGLVSAIEAVENGRAGPIDKHRTIISVFVLG